MRSRPASRTLKSSREVVSIQVCFSGSSSFLVWRSCDVEEGIFALRLNVSVDVREGFLPEEGEANPVGQPLGVIGLLGGE